MDVAPNGTRAPQPSAEPEQPAHQPQHRPAHESVPTERVAVAAGTRSLSVLRELPVLVLVAVVLTFAVRLLLVQAFYVPSGSMEPTLAVGNRVLVSKASTVLSGVHRGDVVVFDGRGSFAADGDSAVPGLVARVASGVGSLLGISPSEPDFVKRVIGVGGDRVACCDAAGRLTVNGVPQREPYLAAGQAPSTVRFDVQVPAGRLWVMGDHRSDSADSRAHLGDPGGGTVPLDRVIGRVVLTFWPLDRAGLLSAASTGERQ